MISAAKVASAHKLALNACFDCVCVPSTEHGVQSVLDGKRKSARIDQSVGNGGLSNFVAARNKNFQRNSLFTTQTQRSNLADRQVEQLSQKGEDEVNHGLRLASIRKRNR